ncbi:putative glycosyl hydrolase-like family 15 (GHL15) protein [Mariniflexile fucanivorans]|uniref:Putative glycosyl hydrolase-like family 15 (GHL15) protein n=1 Tax=Mariniflexile fucanivorans TaxID=264023 RepID=A0A4R1RJP3_9FLAO|nr:putative glycoside hydrolase [Mariniflexile fucanivorans]TCL66209.1 putative glycosyl hydrolase-like family 15 (GHL15) protein [Mariniflexile fucanivorans]
MKKKELIKKECIKTLSVISLITITLFSCGTKKSSFLISDGDSFESKTYFPKFSWESTPMYYHFGDIDRVLQPDEVKFIADRTDFICIEKSHAFNALGDQVLGTKHEVEAFHKVKPEAKVLYYYNSYLAWPYPRFNQEFTPEGIAKNPELAKFLYINPKTGKFREKTSPGFSYYFDALNPDFRKWWVKSAVEGVKISGADGVFIDRMNVGLNSDYPNDQLVEIAKAKGEMMAELKKQMGPDKILIGNNAARTEEVFPHCDAFMFEHYNGTVTNKENLLQEWYDMERIAKAGKISIYRFGAKGKGKTDITIGATGTSDIEQRSKNQLEYHQACFLIGAQPYSYFQWNWGWNLQDGNLVDYPALQKPLGSPKGAFKRETSDGWIFTREFEHASIWVNTDTKEAKITWH